MSGADAPSTSAAKVKVVVGGIPVFLRQCGTIRAAGRIQDLYKSCNCLPTDGQ